MWFASDELREKFLYDTREECCAAFPTVCILASANNATMTASPVGGGLMSPTTTPGIVRPPSFSPTSSPVNTDMPTYEATEDSASSSIHGKGVLLGIATTMLLVALF